MPEISHQKLAAFLKEPHTARTTPIYLFHGDEFLYKKAMKKILDLLLPESQRDYNLLVLDGAGDVITKAVNELNTFSFFGQGKVVIVNDARIFDTNQNKEILIDKIQSAVKDDNQKKAAQFFLNFLSSSGYILDDLNFDSKGNAPHPLLASFSDLNSITKLVQYCRENNLKPSDRQESGDFLQKSIEKGFPENHHLIITSNTIDKRRKLFKIIMNNGLVVDCSVPKGERKADKDAQNAVLRETMQNYLGHHRKSMEPGAYHRLCEMTGFNLPTFSHNLEKLVDFVGDKPVIQDSDVAAIVERSRQDPIYAFTNAILDRNAAKALFFLNSILHQEIHPLQVLSAMVNQIRKLLMAKDFVLNSKGKVWMKGCPYGRFTTHVLPEIEAYDQQMLTWLGSWQKEMNEKSSVDTSAKKKKKKRSDLVSSDLPIKKKTISPYPIYQLMLRTDFFNQKEILASLEKLSQADFKLKTSARSPRLILEDVIFFICKPSIER